MKKLLTVFIVFMALLSCNSGDNNKTDATENAMENNPSVIDDTSTHQPTGITTNNVISTDTAAMRVDNKAVNANEGKEGKDEEKKGDKSKEKKY